MGDAVPALLFRSAVNLADADAGPRTETLTSGRYDLQDVRCRACARALGWRYLRASAGAEKYKEGAVLIGRAALRAAAGEGGAAAAPTPARPERSAAEILRDARARAARAPAAGARLDDAFWDALRAARAAAARPGDRAPPDDPWRGREA
jgi:hypothetical protein